MSAKPTLDTLAKQVQSLRDKNAWLEKEVSALRDILNIHDNWNSKIRDWIGKEVEIHAVDGVDYVGTLKWSDRYNVCLTKPNTVPSIFNKGNIICIEPV
jgi:hypothetical protein